MGSQYIAAVATGNNNTAGASAANTVSAVLAASGGNLRIVSVLLDVQNSGGTQTPGQWVLDLISALGAGGSSLTPVQATTAGKAAAGTARQDAALGVTPTVTTAAIIGLTAGWNHLLANGIEINSGASKGFALRRAVAPSGSQIVNTLIVYTED